MPVQFDAKAPNIPTSGRAAANFQKLVEEGLFEEVEHPGAHCGGRYLVTYMLSLATTKLRSATVISVTNQSPQPNLVRVAFFKGFVSNAFPSGSTSMLIPPDFTVDFASRDLPFELTTVNAVSSPPLTFDEGRALVSSRLPEIGVSARVYYTSGDRDEVLHAITDSKVVVLGQGNHGD
jgi:hypothetical protein